MDKKVADSLMATALTGSQRRKRILTMMRQSSRPLSGGALGRDTGVSRQVVVQDIALLRTEGYPIIATARGYILNETKKAVRLFKVCHTTEQISEELENLKTGKSTPLMNVTAGYHFHHVTADSQEILDEIEEHLRQKHLLAEFLPYELEEESIPDIK